MYVAMVTKASGSCSQHLYLISLLSVSVVLYILVTCTLSLMQF